MSAEPGLKKAEPVQFHHHAPRVGADRHRLIGLKGENDILEIQLELGGRALFLVVLPLLAQLVHNAGLDLLIDRDVDLREGGEHDKERHQQSGPRRHR